MRFKNRRKAQCASRIFIATLCLLAATLFLFFAFEASEPIILPLAKQELADMVTGIVYESLEGIELDEVVTPCYAEDGSITYMRTDTKAINDTVRHILSTLESELGSKDLRIAIPVGDIVGTAISLGQGPDILLELNQYKSINADTKSNFISAGINQTIHRLTLVLHIETVVLLPGMNAEKMTVELTLPMSETLIVGKIPETYITGKDTAY